MESKTERDCHLTKHSYGRTLSTSPGMTHSVTGCASTHKGTQTLPIARALSRWQAPDIQLTCAETFVPSLPLLLNCNGPKHFHVGGSGGMLSVGHAACTEYAELSHRSRKQSVGSRRLDAPPRGPSGEVVPGWDSAPLSCPRFFTSAATLHWASLL